MANYDVIYEFAADNYGLITSLKASELGIPNIELVKLSHRGRLIHIGHGVYKIKYYVPTVYDKYAEAIALTGNNTSLYGESVLAMHGLGLVNPAYIFIASQKKIRKNLPAFIKVIYPEENFNKVLYEGISSQSVFDAIMVCKNTVMSDRLKDAVKEAKKMGLITEEEEKQIRKELK